MSRLATSCTERERVYCLATRDYASPYFLSRGGWRARLIPCRLPTYEPVSSMLSSCMHCASVPQQDVCICETGNPRESQNKTWLYLRDWQSDRFARICMTRGGISLRGPKITSDTSPLGAHIAKDIGLRGAYIALTPAWKTPVQEKKCLV